MKNLLIIIIGAVFLLKPVCAYSQNNEEIAAATAVGVGIALLSISQAKEMAELSATEWILGNTDMKKFNVKTISFNGKKLKDMSSSSLIPFEVYEFDIDNKPNGDYEFSVIKRYVLMMYGYPGFINEYGVRFDKVIWELVDKDLWLKRMEGYVKSSSNPTIDVSEALKNGYVVNKGVTNGKSSNTFLGSSNLAIEFYELNEDSYIVSEYSDDFLYVYNEKSFGLVNKETGVLMQVKRKTILDISKYLNKK
tara:strand:- start:164 stop:913 length:750 start_codon:yes stop_codon:yes gene_type:complete